MKSRDLSHTLQKLIMAKVLVFFATDIVVFRRNITVTERFSLADKYVLMSVK